MNWIMFYQTPYNSVKYLTDDMQEESSLNYFKFCNWVFGEVYLEYRFANPDKLKERLNCFDTLVLKLNERQWEVITSEKKQVDFETLKKFNPNPEELERQQKLNTSVEQSKRYLNSIQDWRRQNDGFNKYR